MAEHNPFQDINPQFFYYSPAPLPKVNSVIKNELFGDIDLPGYEVRENGAILAPANTPKSQEYNYNNLMSEMAATHAENNMGYNTINPNIGERPKQAVQFFVDNGYTVNQAKGIVGNLMHESGDPTLNNISNIGDKGTSFGIAQWHDTSKGIGRWTNLKNWAKENGKSEKDFETQLQFVLKELKENQLWDKRLKSTKTIDEATKSFMEDFERPSKKSAAFLNRLKYANSL